MPSSSRRPPPDAQMLARLAARLEELEDRVRGLERQLRGAKAPGPTRAPRKAASAPGSSRGGSRCPGCTLELPPGRRGGTCVWCGFHFSAVRPPRKRTARSK